MTCDLPEIMAPHNKKTKLIILIKHRRKMMRRHAQSRRKLQGMWRNMQQIVMARYHQLMMSLMLNAAVIFSLLYSLAKDRSQWARLRPGQWWEVVWETYDDKDWAENFRMKRSTFDFIVRALHRKLHHRDTTIWRAFHQCLIIWPADRHAKLYVKINNCWVVIGKISRTKKL